MMSGEQHKVHGYVTGYPGFRPLVGARIEVAELGKTCTTDHTGHYAMYLPRGRHHLVGGADGHEVRSVEIESELEMQVDFLLRQKK